ncbi:MAG: sigma factor-like helix-turn-helix DNA-binding protein [Chloroflexia bacterium]
MPYYHKLGKIPHKRHTQFRRSDGQLYTEELFGTEGFSGNSSLLYHHHPPVRVVSIEPCEAEPLQEWQLPVQRHVHTRTKPAQPQGDPISGRRILMYNHDCRLGIVLPAEGMDYHYKNGQTDELYFIHEGTGRFETNFGNLPYREGDYVFLPHGTIYRVVPDTPEQRKRELDVLLNQLSERERHIIELHYGLAGGTPLTLPEVAMEFGSIAERIRQIETRIFRQHPNLKIILTKLKRTTPAISQRWLVVEGRNIQPPKRYRNGFGQLLEHSPYCERDLRVPEELVTVTGDEAGKGPYRVLIRANDILSSYYYEHHPLDVVGWDGYLYPYIFNIEDFEPITGRVHQPPPVHQTFEAHNFVVCSFVPRKYDYHPLSIPAPYNHSNIDSEEVIYYVNGNFMSRRGIDVASFTLHPHGIPHGPHPGTAEASIGKEATEELAVMVDTFRPLKLTKWAQDFDDPNYPTSWIEGNAGPMPRDAG